MVNPIARNIAQRRAQHLGAQHAYTQGVPGGMAQAGPAAPGPLQPYPLHPVQAPNPMPVVTPTPPQRPGELAGGRPWMQPNWMNRVAGNRQRIDLNGIQDLQAGSEGNRLALARIYDFINSPAARKLTPEQWAVINGKARELRDRIRMNQRMPRPDAMGAPTAGGDYTTMQRYGPPMQHVPPVTIG